MAQPYGIERRARVDHNALRTNQAFIILSLVAAYVLDSWPLVAFVSVVLLAGTLVPAASLFKAVYLYLLRPAGWIRPDPRDDDPAPHRFAQGVGGIVTLASALALAAGWRVPGWTLAAIVVSLAALNLSANVCVGCLLYYWLARVNAPGFRGAGSRRT